MRTPFIATLALLIPALAAASRRSSPPPRASPRSHARSAAAASASRASRAASRIRWHFVDANPIIAVKLRDADLLVDVGLDLEIGWLPPP